MVKKGYYGNECFGLAWDRIEVRQMNLFIATAGDVQFYDILFSIS